MVGTVCEDTDRLDAVLHSDSDSVNSIVEELRSLPASGSRVVHVVTHCEVHLVRAAEVARRLGLTNPFRDPSLFRNKAAMKRALEARGVRVAPWRAVRTPAEALEAATDLGFPVVLKPRDGTGSCGVVRVDRASQLRTAFRRVILAGLGLGCDAALVEKYIEGDEHAVEALTWSGQTEVVLVSDKPEKLEGPCFEESIYLTPSALDAASTERIRFLAASAVSALGLHRGPSHIELRRRGGKLYVLEVAARPGSALPYSRAALGHSYEQACIEALDGGRGPLHRGDGNGDSHGYLLLPATTEGVLLDVVGVEQARALDAITDVRIWKRPGDRLVRPPYFNGYLGTVYARAESAELVQQALVKARELIEVRAGASAGRPLEVL